MFTENFSSSKLRNVFSNSCGEEIRDLDKMKRIANHISDMLSPVSAASKFCFETLSFILDDDGSEPKETLDRVVDQLYRATMNVEKITRFTARFADAKFYKLNLMCIELEIAIRNVATQVNRLNREFNINGLCRVKIMSSIEKDCYHATNSLNIHFDRCAYELQCVYDQFIFSLIERNYAASRRFNKKRIAN